jgi:DNA-binding NarL/FixJ family response regulator
VNGDAGEPIRLLIADDHPIVRDGLTGMFAADPDFSVVGEAADGSQALRLAAAVRPDVILMDLRMPGMDGVTAIAELARRGNPARVLVLTTYDTDSYVLPAIEAGATGYLLKDAPRDELLRAVRAAAAGQSVLSPSVAARLMSRVREPAPEVLSQRELEVLALVAGGSANRETAARLFISEATVKTHLLHIYAKLGVTDRAAAVAEAFNRGLLTPVKPDSRLELQPSKSFNHHLREAVPPLTLGRVWSGAAYLSSRRDGSIAERIAASKSTRAWPAVRIQSSTARRMPSRPGVACELRVERSDGARITVSSAVWARLMSSLMV